MTHCDKQKHQANESKLSYLDADVEAKKCNRDGVLWEADFAQCAGEAESMQKAKRKRDHPGPSFPLDPIVRSADETISQATKTMLSAIAASTGWEGTWTNPNVAPASVML